MKNTAFIFLVFIVFVTHSFAQDWDKVFDEKEGLRMVMKDNKYGFIDNSGNIVLKVEYDKIMPFVRRSQYAIVEKKGKQGVIDKTGNIIVAIEYDKVLKAFAFRSGLDDFALVENNNKKGLVDKSGKLIVPAKYDEIKGFGRGRRINYSVVTINDLDGAIDKTGKLVIPCKYDQILTFRSEKSEVNHNNKWGWITPDGKDGKIRWWASKGEYSKYYQGHYIRTIGTHGLICKPEDHYDSEENNKFNVVESIDTDTEMTSSEDLKTDFERKWRRPTIKELELIHNFQLTDPKEGPPFRKLKDGSYLSCNFHDGDTYYSLYGPKKDFECTYVLTVDGEKTSIDCIDWKNKKRDYHVRLVRDVKLD